MYLLLQTVRKTENQLELKSLDIDRARKKGGVRCFFRSLYESHVTSLKIITLPTRLSL